MDEKLAQLEGVLFSEGADMPRTILTKALGCSQNELAELVEAYNKRSGGLVIMLDASRVLLRAAPTVAPLVQEMRKEAQRTTLGKAGLEVLAIVLYKESATASEVEYIRGVNSGYTLRQLTMRGLVQKHKAGASYRYTPTAALFATLGITDADSLPDREILREKMHQFEKEYVQE